MGKELERVRTYERKRDKKLFVLFGEYEENEKFVYLWEHDDNKRENFEDIRVAPTDLENDYTLVEETYEE